MITFLKMAVLSLGFFLGLALAASTERDPFAAPIQAADAPQSLLAVSLNYAQATEVYKMMQVQGGHFLSPEGRLWVDERANQILIWDAPDKLALIQDWIHSVDLPLPQIAVELRIVVLSHQAQEELGVFFNGARMSGQSAGFAMEHFSVSATISDPIGKLGLSLGHLPEGLALDLELQALESEGESRTLSAPHLLLQDGGSARIEEGQDIPFQTATPTGATQIEFKKAVLGLEVGARIQGKHRILLKLKVNNDHVSKDSGASGQVSLVDTANLSSQIVVEEGQTVVLGGILKRGEDQQISQVPELGNIPLLGALFRSRSSGSTEEELIVFVTPHILPASTSSVESVA